MMTNKYLLILLFLLLPSSIFAQLGTSPPPGSPYVEPCATEIVRQNLISSNPDYADKFEQVNKDIRDYIAANPGGVKTGTVYTIPVVVHIMHTGGAIGTIYNPTDANIIAMIDGLNQHFRNQAPFDAADGVDVEIEFVLAQRDPNCNATNGINRVNASSVAGYVADGISISGGPGVSELPVKALSNWPNTDYYNIWIVNKINGNDGTSGSFIAGYAYFPGASDDRDGTVMLATQITPANVTLPHELGHGLALYHTFHRAEIGEDSANATDCPLNADCSIQGDLVCDTDPHGRMNFTCNTTNCGGVSAATLANYMSYCNGQDKFSDGQKDRMRAALETQRSGLISSLGATPPPATAPATACVPTATGVFGALGVTRFQLNDLNVASPGSDPEGNYVDRTCLQGTTVEAGNTYNFTVQTSVNQHRVQIYIDYNNNGVFTDAGEQVFTGNTNNVGGTHTVNGNITIPTTALTDQPLRLRVVAEWAGHPVPTSCSLTEGQAEDFSLIITSNACAITAITAGAQTACDPGTNTYTQVVTVLYDNPPAGGNLVVNGQAFAIGTSPQTVTLTGLTADGAGVNVTANFSADATCTFTENNLFTAPAACAPTTYYTSGTNTDWHNANAWASSCGGAAGAGIPTATDDVVICAGHTVNHSADAVCNNLTINATGQLNTEDTYDFTVNGTTLVEGIYRDAPDGGAGKNKIFAGDVTVAASGEFGSDGVMTNVDYEFGGSLINNGTFINKNNGTTLFSGANEVIENNGTIRINQDNSGSTLFSANYTLQGTNEIRFYAGSITVGSDVTVTNQGNVLFFYGNVLADNANSHFINDENAFVNFRGSGTIPMAGGQLTAAANNNTVRYTYGGASPVRGNMTYHHLVVYINTKTLEGDIVVNGNLTNNAGPVTNLDANGFDMDLKGNWANNGTFTASNAKVTFSGTAPQNLTGNDITFHEMEMNQAAGQTLTTAVDIEVTQELTLNSGRIVLGNNDITLNNGTVANQISGTYASSWIETNNTGGLIRNGTVTGLQEFPVGNDTALKLIRLSNTENTKVRYIEPGTPTIPPALLGAGLDASWRVESAGTGSGDVRILNPGGATDATSAIRRHDGAEWVELPTTYDATPFYETNGIAIATLEHYAVLSPACDISGLTAGTQTVCDAVTNTYTQEVVVTYSNPPAGGSLVVNGQAFAIGTSPQTVTLTGLTADGAGVNVTASFSDDAACTFTQ
ncbi:MAG: hypothetical protein JJT94_09395, partial [Bernardetiaceae bacterium]|nr:hypothetical protein [Bernardetiaceae bacterium]